MALQDYDTPTEPLHRRQRNSIDDARNYDNAGSVLKWVGIGAFLFLLGLVLFIFVAAPSQDPTGGITRSPATTTVPQSPAPSATSPTTRP